MPPEPGRALTIAALQIARERESINQRWHDGLETRVCAMRRVLWRFRGSAGASGSYACSLEQLVVAVAPAVGWGPVPAAGSLDRQRWFRAHRKTAQRWLQKLQAAGLVHITGVVDHDGYWWRTEVTLLPGGGPTIEPARLQAARARVKGFRARERARVRKEALRVAAGGRQRKLRRLELVLADTRTPGTARRAHLARTRALAVREVRRRRAVEAVITATGPEAVSLYGDLTHPYGAPASLGEPHHRSERRRSPQALVNQRRDRPDQRRLSHRTEIGRRRVPGDDNQGRESPVRNATSEIAARERRLSLLEQQVQARLLRVASWPAGRTVPRWLLREAWVAMHPRHGVTQAAVSGSGQAGNVDATKLTDAITRYERYCEWRPTGWPPTGTAALLVLAARGEARLLAGDVMRLAAIARDMRACAALAGDAAERRRRDERRTRSNAARPPAMPPRLAFRTSSAPVENTAAMRRRQAVMLSWIGENPALFPNLGFAEDHLLAAEARGELPEGAALPSSYLAARHQARFAAPDLDAPMTGDIPRADRYRRECDQGRWEVPAAWQALHDTTPTRTVERPAGR